MKKLILSAALSAIAAVGYAQQEIAYEISFPNIQHHEAEVSMKLNNEPAGSLQIRMARSSPGRYATHEFGKNVYNFKAFDATGKALAVTKVQGDVYQIANHGAGVQVKYTLFGNWVDGTYVGFDDTHAHIMMPATFAYPIGMDTRPRTLKLDLQQFPNWKVATQLKKQADGSYYASNLQYFMDSPVEAAEYKTSSFKVVGGGLQQTIAVNTHSFDSQETIDSYAKMVEKVVHEQIAVWGTLPKFDYGRYDFLHDVYPEYAGDGMEHRNSTTIVQRTPKVAGSESGLLGTFSHEFFHCWNVERLRPKTLEPFQFAHSNVSDGLWLAEGFTQYYGNLILKRAGFRTEESAVQTISGLVNAMLTQPGTKYFTPIEASQYAVFADAGVAIDQTNKNNIFTSYYTYGAGTALALDLRLRSEFKLTLDDYMRALWQAHGKTEIAYTMADLQKVLASLTKSPTFAAEFFNKYIFGTEKNNYEALLLKAGLVLRKANAGKAYTGFGRMDFQNGKAVVPQTFRDTPAYAAGLDFGCIIDTFDGQEIKSADDLAKITEKHLPGQTVTVAYTYHGISKTTQLTFTENPSLEIVSIEKTGKELTEQMKNFRSAWLDSQIKK